MQKHFFEPCFENNFTTYTLKVNYFTPIFLNMLSFFLVDMLHSYKVCSSGRVIRSSSGRTFSLFLPSFLYTITNNVFEKLLV